MKFLLFLTLIQIINLVFCYPPVAVFHGINDQCSEGIVNNLTQELKVVVKCFETGTYVESIFTSAWHQAKKGCNLLLEDPDFQGDFSIIGFSQGGILSRWIIENCPYKGNVVNYASIGGPHGGVSYIPSCSAEKWWCDLLRWLVDRVYFIPIAQN